MDAQTGFLVGYARVSTEDQKLDLQIDALKKAGVHDDNLHVEKISGASAKRPALDLAIKDLREGDTFIVWRADRLARSRKLFYMRLEQIYSAGAAFRSIMEDFDFGTISGKLILGMLALLAEFERQLTQSRTKAGIESYRTRRKSRKWGKAVYMTKERIKRAGELLNGGMSGPKVAEKMKCSTASVYAFWKHAGPGKYVRKYRKPKVVRKQIEA
jgi:DNA invertase Pin-like site-specific DNA recombinase